jgi:hypothetical protein
MNLSLPTPLKAHIVVHYKRDVPEHYDLLISPVGAGEVCVTLRSPVVGETTCRLQPWSTQRNESSPMRAIRSVVGCFFGDIHAAPRIIGAPDWTKVSIDITSLGEQRPRRLLLLELTVDLPTRATFLRSNGKRVVRDESVRLCPEDADPVYAVTRLALSSKAVALLDQPVIEVRDRPRAQPQLPEENIALTAEAA